MTKDVAHAAECLGPETIAAYLEGRLEAGERARIERHLASCEDCYERFTETVALAGALDEDPAPVEKSDAPAQVRQPKRSVPLTYLYLAAASITIMLLTLPFARSRI